MPKIKKNLYIIIALFIMFPTLINAATELGASTQSPVVGTDVYVQLNINYKNFKIGDAHYIITYNTEYLEFEEVIWIQTRGTYSMEPGKITIDKEFGKSWDSGAILQIKYKVLKDGLSKVDVLRNGESHYENGDVIGQSFVGVSISATKPSSQTLIGTLYVEGYTLQPTFSKTVYQYNLIVPPDVSSVNVFASKSDSRQTITGDGYKKLSYGDNNFPVIVTAEDGSSRTYNITVHRTDNRNGDTSLKSLNVSDTNIKYENDKNVYEATVSRSVEDILITARTNDPNATIIGTGRKKLNIGANTFNLTVESSGGRESNYTIIINRSTEEIPKVIKSSKLKTIKVNGLVMDLSDNKTSWLYGIGKDNDKLTIDAKAESDTATIEIIGNENLKVGINAIKIKVSEQNEVVEGAEPTYDITEYSLIVYKNPTNATLINEINNNTFNGDIVFSTSENASHIVPASTLKRLKETKSKLYYNVVNLYNGILYQAIISENIQDSDLDISFKKVSDNLLTYETNIPKGTEMLVYLENLFLDGANVKIYTFNEAGKYTLLTDGITVQNGYISFVTNGEKNYVITTSTLIEEKSPLDQLLAKYKNYILGGIGTIVIALIFINLISKKIKQKTNKGPLY